MPVHSATEAPGVLLRFSEVSPWLWVAGRLFQGVALQLMVLGMVVRRNDCRAFILGQ